MRIVIDQTLCESNGLCEEVAPQVLQLGDDDVLRVLDEQPDEALRPALLKAVGRCPRQALRLED